MILYSYLRAAKIYDFCFGIPYGTLSFSELNFWDLSIVKLPIAISYEGVFIIRCGLVMSGGLLGFAFSRNLTSLSTGVRYGGALLALSTLSMKIWRQGKSSFPYILGQAGNFSFTFFMWTWMFIEMFLFMYESFGAYSFFGTLKMQCFQLLSSGRTSQLILWYFVIFVTMLLIV